MDNVKLNEIVYEMVHSVLTGPDTKAICKNRGFSNIEASSPSLFEAAFLSSAGLANAIKTLSPTEIVALHLLAFEDRVVDVSFFERIYRASSDVHAYRYSTFTQRFKPIFDKVQSQLVRKGLLVINEAKTNVGDKVKLELWRYYFPPAFAQHLPPLLKPNLTSEVVGNLKIDDLREEFLKMTQATIFGSTYGSRFLSLNAGTLLLQQQVFTTKIATQWQQERWQSEVREATVKKAGGNVTYLPDESNAFQGYLLPASEIRAVNPLAFIINSLKDFSPNQWIESVQLGDILKVYYGSVTPPPPGVVCEIGYQTGNLVQTASAGKFYYKLPTTDQKPTELPPLRFLDILDDGTVTIRLESIPYAQLEILNATTALELKNNKLNVVPSVNKLVDNYEEMRQQPLLVYLREHSRPFQELFTKLETDWGKLILHENLLIARINDLSLLQKIKQQSKNGVGVVALPNNYIAFPRALLPEIEKQVKKAGFVVKTVKAE